MLQFTANREQTNALEGLKYWIAEQAATKERAPEDVGNLERVRKTLELVFSQLDRLRVPFWVQNSVICWAEDWRDTLRRSTREAMREKGINLQAL